MKEIKFDPRVFISPPYVQCPKCGKRAFGIVTICDHHYCRRCKECLHPHRDEPPATYLLPMLDKKVIYVDQLAISNMMKALNPAVESHKRGVVDKYWLRLFERLDSLCKLQLIVCPESGFHTSESLVSPYFTSLRRMYELLSCGVTFYDVGTIRRLQVYEHAKNWIRGEPDRELSIDVQSVVRGAINVWQDRLSISLNVQYDPEWINDLRRRRGKTHALLAEVFARWQSERAKTFEDWFRTEVATFGQVYLQRCQDHLNRFAKLGRGRVQAMEKDIPIPPSDALIRSIHDAFRAAGVQDPDLWPQTFEYLTSPSLSSVPSIKISAMLFAALARTAAAGQKTPPNQGMVNDIAMISALLPYCDAMFIDGPCYGHLRAQPLRKALDYGTDVFSPKTKDEFLVYLGEIEKAATREHLDKVNEVYGEDWRKPYTTLYRER